mmetsp:Transcript_44329/g.99782  ORF Transcript_44329/g.99782 Transcript_44329/m.99782 type:complete len:250 (-) Transcript_44329:257-1006(-)
MFLVDRGEQATNLLPTSDPGQRLCGARANVQTFLYKVLIMHNAYIARPSNLESTATLRALRSRNHDLCWLEFVRASLTAYVTERLDEKALTLHTLMDKAGFGGLLFDSGRRIKDSDEQADVEVNGTAHHWLDLPAILGSGHAQCIHDQSEGHFMHVATLQCCTAVPRKASFWVISPKHRHICARHAEEPTISNSLNSRIHEGRACAVRIDINDIISTIAEPSSATCLPCVHEASCVTAIDLNQALSDAI